MGQIKPSFDQNRQILGKILPLETPFNLILDVSEACNFRCSYCFRGQEDKGKWGYAKKQEFMSDEVFKMTVKQVQLFPQTVKQISLSNHGEPLCNRRLPDMVRYIKEQGIHSRISIHTNAAMLDEEYALDLANSDIDRIVVSLQGLTSEKYKEVCGARIDYEEFYHNLEILFKNKKHTNIYYKIMDLALNEGEEEEFYKQYAPIGDRVYVEQMVPIWKDVKLPEADKQKAITNKYGDSFEEQQVCPLIFHTMVVSPVGDVYPCTQLCTPYKLGNINDISLISLWNSELRKSLLIKQCKLDNPKICNGCYISQNSIYTKEDMIDEYRLEILERLYN